MAIYLGTNKVNLSTGDLSTILNLQTKTVSPTTSLQTITADSGYHALSTVKVNAMPTMTLPTAASSSSSGTLKATINRSTSNQYINIPTGYNTTAGYYLISGISNGVATSPTSISGTGSSVSTGTNTLTFTKTVSVTPRITTAGYISAGTAGNSSVSLTASVTTKAAATYTPTTSNQTIGAGTYLTGAQTIKGDSNLLAKNIKNGVSIFGVNGSYNGPEDDITDAVRFFDYDGTILYSYSKDQFLALSTMPANPSHTGLVAQGWNWTLADAQDYVTEWGFLDIGQMYITTSGDTEIDIKLLVRLNPYLRLAVNGTAEIDWGDGSTVNTITGTSLTSAINTQHTYSTSGNYTITIHVINGSFSFYGTSTYYLLHNNSSSGNNNRVFANCIQAVRLGNNVKVGNYAFYYCSSLNYITMPIFSSENTTFGSNPFGYCYGLKHLTIPNNVTNISTIQYCYGLKTISLPKSLTALGGSAFSNDYSLQSLMIPSSSFTPDSAFRGSQNSTLNNMLRLIIPHQNLKQIISEYILDLSGKTTIPNEYFGSILNLLTANIPNTITSIGSYAFYNCQLLTSVTLPSSISSIGSSTFSNCYSLESINIPTNVTSIGSSAFNNCYGLKSVNISTNVTSIGSSAFNGCYSLQSINIPTNITSIEGYTFGYCYCLQEINIPTSVTIIKSYAFSYCSSLQKVTIPVNIATIENYAFNYCYGLKEVYVLSTAPPTISQYTFRGLPSDCTIYVPSASLSDYQAATNWAQYATQMVGV